MEQALLRGTASIADAAKKGRVEEALGLLSKLRTRKLRLDAVAHHAALGALRRRWRRALWLAQEMAEDGLSFTPVTFTLLLTACRPHRWILADLLLLQAGSKASPAAWNVALGISASPKHAIQRWQQMRGALLRPDDVSYGAMVSSCSTSFHWLEAFHILDLAVSNGCRLSQSGYCATLATCSRANRWAEALQTLKTSQGLMQLQVL